MRNVWPLKKFDVEEEHFALYTRGWRNARGAMRHTVEDRYIDAVASRVKQHVETAHLLARVASVRSLVRMWLSLPLACGSLT